MQINSASFHSPTLRAAPGRDAAGSRTHSPTIEPNASITSTAAAPASGAVKPAEAGNAAVGPPDVDEPQSASRASARKRVEEAQAAADLETVRQLAARDREVRAHEQAHMAAGGGYAGSARYTFERGPDGVYYAVGGEVSISTGEASSPEATLRKARIVRRAALAPREPSAADRAVAAQATAMETRALADLAAEAQQSADRQTRTDTPQPVAGSAPGPRPPAPETGAGGFASTQDPAPNGNIRVKPNPYQPTPGVGELVSRFA